MSRIETPDEHQDKLRYATVHNQTKREIVMVGEKLKPNESLEVRMTRDPSDSDESRGKVYIVEPLERKQESSNNDS